PMRSINAAIASDLEIVCQKARDLDKERRYRTADAFAEDLGNVLAHRAITAQAPTTVLLLRRWLQRRPVLATVLVAAFLVCFVAPTVLYVLVKDERDHARGSLAIALRDRVRARQAVETMLTRVANESLFDLPRMQKVRRDLLLSAKTFH